jgi:hypothetical protein
MRAKVMAKREKPIRGKKQRRMAILSIFGAWLIMVIFGGQGLLDVLRGRYAGNVGAWGKPVGGILQLGMVIIILPFAVVWTIRSVRRIRAAGAGGREPDAE